MEISGKVKEQGTVIMALLALALIGLTVVFSTWQTMQNQQSAEEQHLQATSQAIFLALDNAMKRGPSIARTTYNDRRTQELFKALEKEGDVLFAGIVDHRGGYELFSALAQDAPITLPKEVLEGLFATGEWLGRLTVEGHPSYLLAREISPVDRASLRASESPPIPLFLLVSLETDKYLARYQEFRQTAMFQAGYTLGAAVLCWILALSYLTRREKANRAERLEYFQATLLDSIPEGLLSLDSGYNIRSANPAAITMLRPAPADGVAPESTFSLVGKKVTSLPSPLVESIMSEDTNQPQCSPPIWKQIYYDGAYLELLTLPLEKGTDASFLVIIRDRTQLQTLEQNLAEAEKMATIGTLAAGVAHEVRNPLSSLRGFAQYFLKKLQGKSPEEEYARTMVTEADRLNRVISDLLFLGRPKRIQPENIDMETAVVDLCGLLRFDLEKRGIVIGSNLQAKVVHADRDALSQSLLNLVLNSLDAVSEEGGTVNVASGFDKKNTWVEVQDNGCGMTPDQVSQAFNPFFTAKARGTGLGLALVHRTMMDHGGTVSIVSEPDKGCTVRLCFPLQRDVTEGVIKNITTPEQQ